MRSKLKDRSCKITAKPAPKKISVDEDLADICKALGHPARIRLIRILLAKGECISGDLADEFELAPSTVSEHLRILKEAGLVEGAIDGPRRCYCINDERLAQFKALIAAL